MREMPLRLAAALIAFLCCGRTYAVPAFSGAEGWGAVTPGGRGGQVIHVTNLDDSGPGSFRAALTASGPRTVVFDVAGQINLLSEVSVTNPFLTIAGQTAPGAGITIAGETVSLDTHDIIVRHIRFRRGATNEDRRDDSLGSDRTTGNIIIDHVSASWGLDENMSIYRNKLDAPIVPGGSTVLPTRNVTIQWSISSEALDPFRHAFGSTVGGAGVNFHHNLWASNTGRNPSISFSHFMDFRNNVLFNWMHRSVDGAGPEAHVNMINNYYKPGPATGFSNAVTPQPIPNVRVLIVEPEIRGGVFPGGVGWWYVDGNVVEGFPTVSADNWEGEAQVAPGVFARGVQFEQSFPIDWARVLAPHTHVEFPDDPDDPNDNDGQGNVIPIPDLPVIATQTAADAFQWVLAGAGASLVRDDVDVRITNSAATGIATAGPRGDGIITDISQVGGFPSIPFEARGSDFDVDQDGMWDEWELRHGLNPANAGDRNGDFDADGFTNLEEYLGDLGAFPAVEDIVWDGGAGRYALIENWNIAFQPSRFDTAVIDQGTVTVDAVGQHAGLLKLGSTAGAAPVLEIVAGRLEVADEVVIGDHAEASATLSLSGGELIAPILSKGPSGQFNFDGGALHAGEVGFDLVNNGGTLALGESAGETHVLGNLTLADGTLEIEIGGVDGGDFDYVEVDGETVLGGKLRVALIQGYAPEWSHSIEFLNSQGGITQMFDEFDLPPLADGLGWSLSNSGSTLSLSVVLAGDYNGDGTVDAADYTVWRNHVGGSFLANETTSFGAVDEDDYNTWRQNYGAVVALGGGGSTAVPEPAAGRLAAVILAALVVASRGGVSRAG